MLYLPKGDYSLEVFQDGQHGKDSVVIDGEAVKKNVVLQDRRKLYVLFDTAGDYDGDVSALAHISALMEALKAKYPNAVYLTAENRYDVDFCDGDALLTVEIFVENYSSTDRYFASEAHVCFKTYQQNLTAWDTDEGGEDIDLEFADSNVQRSGSQRV